MTLSHPRQPDPGDCGAFGPRPPFSPRSVIVIIVLVLVFPFLALGWFEPAQAATMTVAIATVATTLTMAIRRQTVI
jgi:hypothetical protein